MPEVLRVLQAHGKSIAQVVVRWLIQRNVVATPKSVRPERMQENLEVFDFELSDDELAQIAAMERGESLFFDHRDPEWVTLIGTRPIA